MKKKYEVGIIPDDGMVSRNKKKRISIIEMIWREAIYENS